MKVCGSCSGVERWVEMCGCWILEFRLLWKFGVFWFSFSSCTLSGVVDVVIIFLNVGTSCFFLLLFFIVALWPVSNGRDI